MSSQLAKQDIEIKGGLVSLTSLSDAMEYARNIVKSGLAPNAFRTPEAVLIAMQHGAELGLKPLASLQHISVVNGRPALYGKALPGVIQATGLMVQFDESIEGDGNDMVAVCTARRKGMDKARTERFSAADAKRAGLWGKSGPWTQYPKDMLRYKARARCLGSLFADVLCGIPVYEDYQDVVVSPEKEIAPPPASPDPLMAQIEEQPIHAEEAEFEVRDELPRSQPSDTPDTAGVREAVVERPTTEQLKKLSKRLKESGKTVQEFRNWLYEEHEVKSMHDMDIDQFEEAWTFVTGELY